MNKNNDNTSGLLNWNDRKQISGKIICLIIFIILLAISLVCLLPVVWMALSSFKTTQEMYAIPPALFPEKIDFGRITTIWQSASVGAYALNSLWIIIGCLSFDIVFNGLAGYVLSRVRPLGSVFINTALFWTMMLPGISMVPLYMTFVDLPVLHINMTGTFAPLWIQAMTNAFNIFLFRNFFNGIPMGYLEAARIDGCSAIGVFFKVILPLSTPIISVVAIFSIIGSWGNFLWPYLVLGNTSLEPVSVLLYKLTNATSQFKDNDRMLIMFMAAVPSIIVYAVFSKRIMGGLNMSGIKG